MTIQGSFGEQPVDEKSLLLWLNSIAIPLLKKMLQAQNDCDCEGGGGGGHDTVFSLTEPAAGDYEDGDAWLETA